MIYSVLGSLILASSASAAEWSLTAGTSATTLVGVGADSETLDVAAASQNGIGAMVERFDGSNWGKEQVPAGLIMDAAVSTSVTVAVSMFPIVTSTDGGNTWVEQESIGGLSQSASVFGSGQDIGLVGGFTTPAREPVTYGVAHSADAGSTWTISEIPGPGYVRYGAFPSETTWYVSSGMWGSDAALRSDQSHYSLSSRAAVSFSGKQTLLNVDNKFSSGVNVTDVSGWWGTISKTTDAGQTWQTVFQSDPSDTYYFNSIACSSDTHCVAVAEGANYVTDCKAFVTFDGGETWTNTLEGAVPSDAVSLMGASWASETVGWLAGTAKDGRTLNGLFYKTTDGGKTFAVEQTLSDCFAMDLDFADESYGVASCSSSSGSSASVATYQ